MSQLSPETYRQLEAQLHQFLAECSQISANAIAEVQHYLDNAEIEMAFESILLALDEEQVSVPARWREILYPIGLQLGLSDDGVLIGDKWLSLSARIKPDGPA